MTDNSHIRRTALTAAMLPMLGLVAAACGDARPSVSSSTSTPAVPVKPADAAQAAAAAVDKTAKFRDVQWDDSQVIISAGQRTEYGNTYTATQNPPRIQNKTKPTAGASSFTHIRDLSAHTTCVIKEGETAPGPSSPDDATPPEITDPFHELSINGSAWRYLPDTDVNGHSDWRLMGNLSVVTAPGTPYAITSNTAEVFINPQSGRIEKVVQHATLTRTDASGVTDRTIVDSAFAYDTGVTIPHC